MRGAKTYTTQRIDHLGIVTGISREIELVETIDKQVGQTGRKVSCGEGTLAMIQNALGFSSRALYLMPDYLYNKHSSEHCFCWRRTRWGAAWTICMIVG